MSVRSQLPLLCHCCGLFEPPSFSKLLSHVRLVHADDPDFKINCKLEGCCHTFTRFQTYRNHVYTYHKNAFRSKPPNVGPSESQKSDSCEDPSVVRDFYQEDNSTFDNQGESSECYRIPVIYGCNHPRFGFHVWIYPNRTSRSSRFLPTAV